VFESADLVGGAAAFSGGQVWVGANHVARRQGIEDSLELAERYVRAIAHDHPELLDERAMLRWLSTSPAAASTGRTSARSGGRSSPVSRTTTTTPTERSARVDISPTRSSTVGSSGSGATC
jgi:predicted oxidoreductase